MTRKEVFDLEFIGEMLSQICDTYTNPDVDINREKLLDELSLITDHIVDTLSAKRYQAILRHI